jgi:hypothetical protein
MLKLYPPRKGSPNWRVRGKYLGISESTLSAALALATAKSPPEFSPSGRTTSNVVHMPNCPTRHSPRPR